MKRRGPFQMLVAGSVIVAILATVTVSGGWLIWVPVGLALATAGKIWHDLGR
jgi:hypothetical protein